MKILELLDRSDKWTQHVDAWDGVKECRPTAVEAQCFCLSGAIIKCYKGDKNTLKRVERKIQEAIKIVTGRRYGIVAFNDDPDTDYLLVKRVLENANV